MVVDQRWRILTLKPSKSNHDQHAPLSSQLPAAYPISLPKNYCGCQTGNERSESVEKPVCFLGKTGNYFNLEMLWNAQGKQKDELPQQKLDWKMKFLDQKIQNTDFDSIPEWEKKALIIEMPILHRLQKGGNHVHKRKRKWKKWNRTKDGKKEENFLFLLRKLS